MPIKSILFDDIQHDDSLKYLTKSISSKDLARRIVDSRIKELEIHRFQPNKYFFYKEHMILKKLKYEYHADITKNRVPISSVSSVGKVPAPTRVVYAFTTPITSVI